MYRSGDPDFFLNLNLWKFGWIQHRLTWKRAVFFWYLRPVSFLIVISLRTQGTGHLHRKSIASSLWKFPKIWRIFAKPYSIFFLVFVLFLPSRATNFLGCSSVNFCKWLYWHISNPLFEVSLLLKVTVRWVQVKQRSEARSRTIRHKTKSCSLKGNLISS